MVRQRTLTPSFRRFESRQPNQIKKTPCGSFFIWLGAVVFDNRPLRRGFRFAQCEGETRKWFLLHTSSSFAHAICYGFESVHALQNHGIRLFFCEGLCAVIFHMGIIPISRQEPRFARLRSKRSLRLAVLTLGFSACVLKTSCPPIDESGLYHTANRWNTISKVFTNYK